MILITGCGRSGTDYTTEALRTIGLRVRHEKRGRDGEVSWRLPYSPTCSQFDTILHQVRTPLKAIASCHTLWNQSWGIICEIETRIHPTDSILLRSMKYWLYWNRQAQKVSEMTYQIEQIDIRKIASMAGINPSEEQFAAVNNVSKSRNSRRKKSGYRKLYPSITFEDLIVEDKAIAEEIAVLATEYGYETPR